MIKKIILLLTLFCAPLLPCSTEHHSQTPQDPFVVVLMVKNEESVINKTLEPFISEGLHSFLIFDTGSTDATVETVTDYFKKNNIKNWCLFQEPFIDFSTSRNRALDLAEECFGDATFFLFPDAEWYLHNVKGLMKFCTDHHNDPHKCYLIRLLNQRWDFSTPRLIRAKTGARFVGDVHEVVVTDSYEKVPADIFFELGASRAGIEKSKKRWERDLVILSNNHEKDPENPRTTFYLAQTHECLGNLEKAYEYYLLRSGQAGWFEENYETFFRLGRITEELAKTNTTYSWDMAQNYYFSAHKILPLRAEPLVRLAEHYWPDGSAPTNAALCYLYAKRAYELAYPHEALLFVDPSVYHFKRYELVSKSAWHVGDFSLGLEATRKALALKELPYLLRNLACYLEAAMPAAQ